MKEDIYNTDKKYQILYADPPWEYFTYSKKGKGRSAESHYEATRKEWRKETTAQFNTRLPRKEFEEIETFLKERHLRKLDLIYEGYFSYLKKFGLLPEDETEDTKE